MQDQHSRRFIPWGLLAGFSVLVVGSGSAIAWWTWNAHFQSNNPAVAQKSQEGHLSHQRIFSSSSDSPVTAPQKFPSPPVSTAEKLVQVYWLQPSGDRIKLVANPVKLIAGSSPEVLLQATMNQLLAGPVPDGNTSTIPQQTKLRSLSIQEDGVHLDLSLDFTTGGGSTAMIGRVAQVLYTATSVNPNTQVWLSVEGKPLEILGGEGVVLRQPLTRDLFQRDFPDSLIR